MRSLKLFAGAICAALTLSTAAIAAEGPGVKYGKAITEGDLVDWNIDISTTDGKGLPAGKGSVADGKKVFAEQCASCHGDEAKGGSQFGSMVGGIGSFTTDKRVLTPGSMYPYSSILFDYVRRAMPMTAPQSLTDDQVYAVSAYILSLNGLVPADAVLDAKSLVAVQMPNKDGFIVDDRPDTKATRCMKDCPPIKD